MAKLFKIQAYIVDYGDEFCSNKYLQDYLIHCTQHDLNLDHLKIQSVELREWDDNHPLNRVDAPESEYEKYFVAKEQEDSLHPVSKRELRAKTNIIDGTYTLPFFTCSLCGKTILAELVIHKDGTIEIKQENTQIRGGLGNQVLYDNVCSQCAKKMNCFKKEN